MSIQRLDSHIFNKKYNLNFKNVFNKFHSISFKINNNNFNISIATLEQNIKEGENKRQIRSKQVIR